MRREFCGGHGGRKNDISWRYVIENRSQIGAVLEIWHPPRCSGASSADGRRSINGRHMHSRADQKRPRVPSTQVYIIFGREGRGELIKCENTVFLLKGEAPP